MKKRKQQSLSEQSDLGEEENQETADAAVDDPTQALAQAQQLIEADSPPMFSDSPDSLALIESLPKSPSPTSSSTQTTTNASTLIQNFRASFQKPSIIINTEDDYSYFDASKNDFPDEAQKGISLLRQNQYDEALQAFNKAFSPELLLKTKLQLRYFIAEAKELSGIYREALEDFLSLHSACNEAFYTHSAQDITKRYGLLASKLHEQLIKDNLQSKTQAFLSMQKTWLNLHEMQQGKPILEAARVEQGEYGWSDKTPMGTDNILQCIIVIIRDNQLNLTALAHVDNGRNPASLQQVFNKFEPGHQLDVHLLGGILSNREDLIYAFAQSANLKEVTDAIESAKENANKDDRLSLSNFAGILKVLDAHSEHINISAGDVGLYGDEHTHAIVVYPETGVVTPGWPASPYPDKSLRQGTLDRDSDLQAAYFINSEPVYLDKKNIDTHTKYIDLVRNNHWQIDELETKRMPFIIDDCLKLGLPETTTAKMVKGTLAVIKAYMEATKAIKTALLQDYKITTLPYQTIDAEIKKHGIFLGETSAVKNTSLVEEIHQTHIAKSFVTTTSSMSSSSSAVIASNPDPPKPPFVKGKAVPEHSVFKAKANILQEASTTQSATTTSSANPTSTPGLGTGQPDR